MPFERTTVDPITILMFALIAVLIFFMFRNGKKRQQAMQELQNGLRPGAEVMLQSGIFGTIESVDDENNRATLRSGTTTLEVHRNAITQIIAPVESTEDEAVHADLAPDDDPEFGERIANGTQEQAPKTSAEIYEERQASETDTDSSDEEDKPKA